jgi:hypothetical protein
MVSTPVMASAAPRIRVVRAKVAILRASLEVDLPFVFISRNPLPSPVCTPAARSR